ncbi:uncharacterized protein N7483_003346 [Penicillium malachiteum]|uniref:uncharacterized protein n=1 Tax=Penicillium malachiteum TaxID=1324776 RepID=UPI002546DBC9|nr:uncharacterized protein N7483_003346 [Penicillium malachiteum]KAJ5728838.1 hypothetical protein N7483_003346 [Penicillium malachiteum]
MMLSLRPPYLILFALVLLIIKPATSHPVRSSKWTETTRLEEYEAREHGNYHDKTDQDPFPVGTLLGSDKFKRDTLLRKPPGVVLVPGGRSPASERLHRHWNHRPKGKYGEIFGHAKESDKVGTSGISKEDTQTLTSPSLRLSTSHDLSFFSYRISFPFFKLAPMSLPQLPLPGIFTTVMILLALVWIAILAIGLVEVANYLWRRRRIAHVAADTDRLLNENSSSTELVKEPFQVLVVPRAPRRLERLQDENPVLVQNDGPDGGSDSETEIGATYV